MGQTSPALSGALALAQAPTGAPVLPVDPLSAGIGMAVIGLTGFLLCRLVLSRHWNRIKSDPHAHPFGAIWTDVLVRLISYVCGFVFFLGLLLAGARLAGKI